MPDSVRRMIRTAVQLIAGGGLYVLTDQFAKDIPAQYTAYLWGGYTILVTVAQNYAEDAGWIPSVLKASASSGADPLTHDPVK